MARARVRSNPNLSAAKSKGFQQTLESSSRYFDAFDLTNARQTLAALLLFCLFLRGLFLRLGLGFLGLFLRGFPGRLLRGLLRRRSRRRRSRRRRRSGLRIFLAGYHIFVLA